ncbi:restriction endonuclease subunit S [Pediococcus argentinicus]|uniref:restriction endonuclease subunit S n=1 Tax=Pediococcus argentinicus TaxID=480391 RepID=UPI001FF89053|nr:restriction endonuclease subunit S [Pediococcus argentinicus]
MKHLLTYAVPKHKCTFLNIYLNSCGLVWEQRKLGQIARIQGGGTPDSKNKDYWDGDINWFTPTEVGHSVFLNESRIKITKNGLDHSSAKLMPKDSILMTSRAGVGSMGILNEPAATNQGFQSFILKSVYPYFIYAMQPIISKIANKLASGSTFTEISGTEVKKISIAIPLDEAEQKSVGRMAKVLDDTIAANQCKQKGSQIYDPP